MSLATLARTNWKLATQVFAGIGIDREPTEAQVAMARQLRTSISPNTAARYIELFAGVGSGAWLLRTRANESPP